jgi:hypothetical protein
VRMRSGMHLPYAGSRGWDVIGYGV